MKLLKTLMLIASVFLSMLLAYFLGVKITEKYFFDRLYYQKSEKFGYFPEDNEAVKRLTRSRMTGLDLLSSDDKSSNTLGVQSNTDTFNIAVIGDSHVWGMGIKKNERFSEILNKKLNLVRKTKVVNVGYPGDNFLENLSKFTLLAQNHPQDLYVYLLFRNDILLWSDERYYTHTALQDRILKKCESLGPYLYDGDSYKNITIRDYTAHVRLAWENDANLCAISEGAKFLPDNAIYLIADNDSRNTDYTGFISILSAHNLPVQLIYPNSPGVEKYKQYFNDRQKYFYVSQKDAHFSALANRMIADYLFTEITNNNRWKFSQK
jgi:hypothetical protein